MSSTVIAIIAAVAAIVLCGVVLWLAALLRRARGVTTRTSPRRPRLAREHDAEALLQNAGYHIVARQVRHIYTPTVDDEPHAIEVRADYLVEANGERLVAEVKTGDTAPSLDVAATRRQLLEYRVAFAADAVLLVCPERGAIHRIDFPMPANAGRCRSMPVDALSDAPSDARRSH